MFHLLLLFNLTELKINVVLRCYSQKYMKIGSRNYHIHTVFSLWVQVQAIGNKVRHSAWKPYLPDMFLWDVYNSSTPRLPIHCTSK